MTHGPSIGFQEVSLGFGVIRLGLNDYRKLEWPILGICP